MRTYQFNGLYSLTELASLIGRSRSWVKTWHARLGLPIDYQAKDLKSAQVHNAYSFHTLIALLHISALRHLGLKPNEIEQLILANPQKLSYLLTKEFILKYPNLFEWDKYHWDTNEILQEWFPSKGACVAGYRCFGRPTIIGHRIPLEGIVDSQVAGETLNDIYLDLGITCSFSEFVQAVKWYKGLS